MKLYTLKGLVLLGGMMFLAATPKTHAASCCGGGSITDQFAVPKWERALLGTSVQVQSDVDMRDESGRRVRARSWSNRESRLTIGAGYRLAKNWQGGASVPLVLRQTQAGVHRSTGTGIGDIGFQLRYEILDEETCFLQPFRELKWNELKPSVHWVTTVLAPTGRPTGKSTDGLGASVTGRGFWVGDTGIQATKVWGQWGNSIEASIGYQHPGRAGALSPAYRWSVGGSVLFYPEYRKYIGLHLAYREESVVEKHSSGSSTLSPSLVLSWVPPDAGWWLRGAFGPSGLGIGRNTPVSWQGLVSLARTFL